LGDTSSYRERLVLFVPLLAVGVKIILSVTMGYGELLKKSFDLLFGLFFFVEESIRKT